MTTQPDRGHGLTVGAVVADTYQVTRLLGRGGMGAVWEASHLRLPGKRVAIKVLHADIAADQEALARFRREAEIATRLGHPNIVEVHDFNTLPDGKPYLVLELLVGESLDSRLRRAPVSVDDAMRIAAQIGAALAAAHREHVVHRDLKPQNVFLVRPRDDGDGGEVVKVLDFGISKIRGSQTVKTLETTLLGTPQYMSPEQATGNHAAVDQRTDVFALGAIVYEMLVGRPAFTGQSIPEVVFKVVYEHPAPLAELVPGLPPRVADAVGRALSKAQDDRYPDVVTFVEEMAGVSLSTLRRSPISLAPAARTPATGMESTIAAPSTDRSRAPGGPTGDGEPDPLARTVDSGRRELAALPRASSSPPPSIPSGLLEGRTESMPSPQVLPRRGPTDKGAEPTPRHSIGEPAEPTPRHSIAGQAEPTPRRSIGEPAEPTPRHSIAGQAESVPLDRIDGPLAEPLPRGAPADGLVAQTAASGRRGRRLALLLASLFLVAAGAATAVLIARPGESDDGRGMIARGDRASAARRAAAAADQRGEGGQRGRVARPGSSWWTPLPQDRPSGAPGDEASTGSGGEAALPPAGPTTGGEAAAAAVGSTAGEAGATTAGAAAPTAPGSTSADAPTTAGSTATSAAPTTAGSTATSAAATTAGSSARAAAPNTSSTAGAPAPTTSSTAGAAAPTTSSTAGGVAPTTAGPAPARSSGTGSTAPSAGPAPATSSGTGSTGRTAPAPSRTGATSTGSTATTALASSPTVGTSTGSTAAPALASSPTPGTGAAALTGRPRGPAPGRAGAGEAAPAGTAGGARVSRPRPRPPRGGRTPTRDTEEGEAAGRPGDAEVRGELRAALAAGEQAMRDGDLRRAIVLAERALRHGGGPAAHSLHARASCGLGDLGNAKASFLRIPRRNRALRRVVTAACSRAGIDVGR